MDEIAADPVARGARWLAGSWSLFQLYTAALGTFDLLIQLPVHVASAVALGYLVPPTPDSAAAAAKLAQRPTSPLAGSSTSAMRDVRRAFWAT